MAAHRFAEDRSRQAKHLVARRVTEGIVVLLEMIEIQHDQRQGSQQPVGLAEEQFEIFAKPAAVLGAGQLVDGGELREQGILARELFMNLDNPLGDLEPNGQLIGVGRLGQEIVGAGAQAVESVFTLVA